MQRGRGDAEGRDGDAQEPWCSRSASVAAPVVAAPARRSGAAITGLRCGPRVPSCLALEQRGALELRAFDGPLEDAALEVLPTTGEPDRLLLRTFDRPLGELGVRAGLVRPAIPGRLRLAAARR